ncbi:MAG TPA: LemA family protein [Caldimonas sp.]
MSRLQIGAWIAAAVLLFWAVGAYNRLVGLRNAIVRSFGPIDEQFSARHALLEQQLDAVGALLANAAQRLDALRAACLQADAARAHAKAHPGAPGAVTSLRLADDILTEARARLPVQTVGGLDMSELNARLAATDAALAFARGQFNAAVLDYNRAVRQIPTRLLAALFGFAPAGTL